MSDVTPWSAIPFPELSDSPNGPVAFFNQASGIDKLIIPQFASAAARDTAATAATLTEGMKCWRTDTHRMESYDGVYWCEHVPRRIIPPGVGNIVNNSATVNTDVTGFAFTVKAGFYYNFYFQLAYRRADPAGIFVGFTSPAGTTMSWRPNGLAEDVDDNFVGIIDGFDHGASYAEMGGVDDNTKSQLAFLMGLAVITTDGTVQMQIHQTVTTAGTGNSAIVNLQRSWGYVETLGPTA